MSAPVPPQQLSIVALAYRSQQELQKFQQGAESDPQYAFELFRRALIEPRNAISQEAWEAIYRQYYATVVRWAQRHPLYPLTGETGDYFATLALTKLWLYFAEGRGDIDQFPDLRRLLSFLQVCVNHVVIDYYRTQLKQGTSLEQMNTAIPIHHRQQSSRDESPVDQIERAELWHMIYQEAQSELERLWIYAYCELLLPRRKIVELFPEFGSVDQVKQVMDTFLKRVRRNERLKHWLADYNS
jgi:hypothetical protein